MFFAKCPFLCCSNGSLFCCGALQRCSSFTRRFTFSELSTLGYCDIFRRLFPARWLLLEEPVELREGQSWLVAPRGYAKAKIAAAGTRIHSSLGA